MKVHMYDSNYIDRIGKIIKNESITLDHYDKLLSSRELDSSTRSIIETMKINTEDHIALLNTIRDDEISELDDMIGDDDV